MPSFYVLFWLQLLQHNEWAAFEALDIWKPHLNLTAFHSGPWCMLDHYHGLLGKEHFLVLLRSLPTITGKHFYWTKDLLHQFNVFIESDLYTQLQKTCKSFFVFSLFVSFSIPYLSSLTQAFQSSGSTKRAEICQLSEEFTEDKVCEVQSNTRKSLSLQLVINNIRYNYPDLYI